MSTESTPEINLEQYDLAKANATHLGLHWEFSQSVLTYLLEHAPYALVASAISDANLEWDL
jgi:hypothetical protein